MLLVVPLVAVAPQVCPRGLRTGEIVPMPVLVSRLCYKVWDLAAGIAERAALSPRDLVVLLTRAGFPRPVAVAESWSPAFPNCLPAAVNLACPRPVAVAESWSLACPSRIVAAESWGPARPRPVAVVENWSPAPPTRQVAALHSDPMRPVAVSPAHPTRRVAARIVPRDYRPPAPVDSSHPGQPVVPGVANRKLRQVQLRSYPSWIFRRVAPASL